VLPRDNRLAASSVETQSFDHERARSLEPMRKHLATLAGLLLAGSFLLVFFLGRRPAYPLEEIAPRVGLKAEQLIAMAPRVASQTGATLGTARRVIYLMACSGVPASHELEMQATRAAEVAERRSLTPREATRTVLAAMPSAGPEDALRDC